MKVEMKKKNLEYCIFLYYLPLKAVLNHITFYNNDKATMKCRKAPENQP